MIIYNAINIITQYIALLQQTVALLDILQIKIKIACRIMN